MLTMKKRFNLDLFDYSMTLFEDTPIEKIKKNRYKLVNFKNYR